MAATSWSLFDSTSENFANGLQDLDTHTHKLALYQSTSNVDDTRVNLADLTNEVASGNGYTTGGATLTNVTLVRNVNVTSFDSDDVVFAASGGSIVTRWAVIYNDTAAGKPLIAWSLLDDTPADITVTDTNTLTIQMNASGIFTITA